MKVLFTLAKENFFPQFVDPLEWVVILLRVQD